MTKHTLIPKCNKGSTGDPLAAEISVKSEEDYEGVELGWQSPQGLARGPIPRLMRRQGCWQKPLCFEVFFGARSGQYFEFNLTPAGEYNFYAFDHYRQGQREVAVKIDRFELQPHWVSCRLNLNQAAEKAMELIDFNLAVIVGTRYYSFKHGATADFHNRLHWKELDQAIFLTGVQSATSANPRGLRGDGPQ